MALVIATQLFAPPASAAEAPMSGACAYEDARGIGAFTDIEAADRVFLAQWGPNRWNSRPPIWGKKDCGPTSSLMALAALGYLSPVTPGGAASWIGWMRDLERGFHTTRSHGTGMRQIRRGLAAAGARSTVVAATPRGVDEGLANGGVVIVSGNPANAWVGRLWREGSYLVPPNPFGHWVAILGKTADGRYLVADPLSLRGVIAVGASGIRRYASGLPRSGAPSQAVSVQ